MRARVGCPPAHLRTRTHACKPSHALTVCSTPNSRASQVVVRATIGAMGTRRYPLAQNLTLFRVVVFVLCGSVAISIAVVRSTFLHMCWSQRTREHPGMQHHNFVYFATFGALDVLYNTFPCEEFIRD